MADMAWQWLSQERIVVCCALLMIVSIDALVVVEAAHYGARGIAALALIVLEVVALCHVLILVFIARRELNVVVSIKMLLRQRLAEILVRQAVLPHDHASLHEQHQDECANDGDHVRRRLPRFSELSIFLIVLAAAPLLLLLYFLLELVSNTR